MSALMALAACNHESIDDRAEREAREFTEKNCPTPEIDHTRTDSLAFDRSSRTLTYYMSLFDIADNKEAIDHDKARLHQALLSGIINATNLKAYKDAGLTFRYVYHSGSNPGTVLYETTFTKKEYGN